jgi:hypothetical protein
VIYRKGLGGGKIGKNKKSCKRPEIRGQKQ